MPLLFLGQGLQDALGPGLDRQDAFHGRVGIRAVTDSPLQRGDQVPTGVRSQQGQHPLRLVLAVSLPPEQALQETTACLSQFRESFLQLGLALLRILGGAVLLVHAPLPRGRARQQGMPGDLLDLRTVNDDLGLGHPHRQHAADVTPRHRVAILAVSDQAFDVDRAVDHRGDVIGLRRQRDQMGPFFLMQLQRRLLGFPQHADVGDMGQPPGGGLVEMIQRLEAPAIE